MRYASAEDARRQLGDTIVMHNHQAFYVHGIDDALRLVGEYVLTEERAVVEQDDPLLSLSCPSLGYINSGGNAYYFMRQPVRRWKQGIDTRALVCPSEGIRARGVLSNRVIAECLEGRYPTLSEGMKRFERLNPFKTENTTEGVAFSRHFAVKRGAEGALLFYKGREVGVVENKCPILSTKYHWLTELMESEV